MFSWTNAGSRGWGAARKTPFVLSEENSILQYVFIVVVDLLDKAGGCHRIDTQIFRPFTASSLFIVFFVQAQPSLLWTIVTMTTQAPWPYQYVSLIESTMLPQT